MNLLAITYLSMSLLLYELPADLLGPKVPPSGLSASKPQHERNRMGILTGPVIRPLVL